MRKVLCSAVLLASCFIVSQPSAYAQEEVTPPEGVNFTRIRGTRDLRLNNCPLVQGITRVTISGSGKYVQLPVSLKRGAYELARRYNYFACADQGDGQYVIYAKVRMYKKVFKYALELSDFPRNSMARHCANIISWPANLIYKTIGSGHFPLSDCRRNSIGMVAKWGYRGPSPSPIQVLDTQGNNVGGLGMYARGGLYAWRAYGCVGGTPARNGAAVANLARRNTGSKNVYFDFGNTCYGPVPADRCIGSSQC